MSKPSKPQTSATGQPITVFSSPRERFQSETENISAHHALVDGEAFELGSDAALCEYVTKLGRQALDPNKAMAVGFKLAGAVEFLNEFKTLAEVHKPLTKPIDPDNLTMTEPQRRI